MKANEKEITNMLVLVELASTDRRKWQIFIKIVKNWYFEVVSSDLAVLMI